eukprot:CAMPEP_0194291242 /NCGR_PEP_ID=MMETSP0169-20130528/43051_1 /TAXON_ID=218684 /ORGANISM="Corethron pennatum, Strain L29A3" /LENGTH=615 /DNA_ID=CAMNT_0039039069 /DNA_START=234 /DNA_END=2081 /DNA_ORIENTATION=+
MVRTTVTSARLAETISTTQEKINCLFMKDDRPKTLAEYARKEKALQKAKGKDISTGQARILRITNDISQAENQFDLIVAVEAACAKFDHFDKYTHDEEIESGVAGVLFFQLERVVTSSKPRDSEIELLVSALEMVHRCSCHSIKNSIKAAGKYAAFQVPCHIVEKYTRYPQHHACAPTIVCLVAKLFTNFTKATGVMQRMAENYDIILVMVHVLECDMHEWVKMEAINVLAELAYSEETNSVMIHVDGFIDALTECANSSNKKIKEGSARAFLNLATAAENRPILGSRDDTVNVLLKCLHESSNTTRKCAIGALGNMSACEENKLRLVNYGNGEIVKTLLFAARSDVNKQLRKDAMGVLANLSNADTSCLLCTYPDFLNSLVTQAACDAQLEIQRGALKVLRRMASFVDATVPCHALLLKALLKALAGKHAVAHVVAALKDQSSKPANRRSLAQFPGLLDALAVISLEVEDARVNAVKTLLFVAYQNDGATYAASECVLSALATAAGLTKKKDVLTRFAAIKTIKKLALREDNRAAMERSTSLLVALKWTVKKAAKIVAITDTLTEFLTGSPEDMLDTVFDAIDGELVTVIRDEDLSALAHATLLTIIPASKIHD